jgi:hypothetical protein
LNHNRVTYLRKEGRFVKPTASKNKDGQYNPMDIMTWIEPLPKVTLVTHLADGQLSIGWSVRAEKDSYNRERGIQIAEGRLKKRPVTVPLIGAENQKIKDSFRQAVLDRKFDVERPVVTPLDLNWKDLPETQHQANYNARFDGQATFTDTSVTETLLQYITNEYK